MNLRTGLLAGPLALALTAATGCSAWRSATRLEPGQVHCTTTNSEYLTSRHCFVGTESGENKLVSTETCVKEDGEVTGCSTTYQ